MAAESTRWSWCHSHLSPADDRPRQPKQPQPQQQLPQPQLRAAPSSPQHRLQSLQQRSQQVLPLQQQVLASPRQCSPQHPLQASRTLLAAAAARDDSLVAGGSRIYQVEAPCGFSCSLDSRASSRSPRSTALPQGSSASASATFLDARLNRCSLAVPLPEPAVPAPTNGVVEVRCHEDRLEGPTTTASRSALRRGAHVPVEVHRVAFKTPLQLSSSSPSQSSPRLSSCEIATPQKALAAPCGVVVQLTPPRFPVRSASSHSSRSPPRLTAKGRLREATQLQALTSSCGTSHAENHLVITLEGELAEALEIDEALRRQLEWQQTRIADLEQLLADTRTAAETYARQNGALQVVTSDLRLQLEAANIARKMQAEEQRVQDARIAELERLLHDAQMAIESSWRSEMMLRETFKERTAAERPECFFSGGNQLSLSVASSAVASPLKEVIAGDAWGARHQRRAEGMPRQGSFVLKSPSPLEKAATPPSSSSATTASSDALLTDLRRTERRRQSRGGSLERERDSKRSSRDAVGLEQSELASKSPSGRELKVCATPQSPTCAAVIVARGLAALVGAAGAAANCSSSSGRLRAATPALEATNDDDEVGQGGLRYGRVAEKALGFHSSPRRGTATAPAAASQPSPQGSTSSSGSALWAMIPSASVVVGQAAGASDPFASAPTSPCTLSAVFQVQPEASVIRAEAGGSAVVLSEAHCSFNSSSHIAVGNGSATAAFHAGLHSDEMPSDLLSSPTHRGLFPTSGKQEVLVARAFPGPPVTSLTQGVVQPQASQAPARPPDTSNASADLDSSRGPAMMPVKHAPEAAVVIDSESWLEAVPSPPMVTMATNQPLGSSPATIACASLEAGELASSSCGTVDIEKPPPSLVVSHSIVTAFESLEQIETPRRSTRLAEGYESLTDDFPTPEVHPRSHISAQTLPPTCTHSHIEGLAKLTDCPDSLETDVKGVQAMASVSRVASQDRNAPSALVHPRWSPRGSPRTSPRGLPQSWPRCRGPSSLPPRSSNETNKLLCAPNASSGVVMRDDALMAHATTASEAVVLGDVGETLVEKESNSTIPEDGSASAASLPGVSSLGRSRSPEVASLRRPLRRRLQCGRAEPVGFDDQARQDVTKKADQERTQESIPHKSEVEQESEKSEDPLEVRDPPRQPPSKNVLVASQESTVQTVEVQESTEPDDQERMQESTARPFEAQRGSMTPDDKPELQEDGDGGKRKQRVSFFTGSSPRSASSSTSSISSSSSSSSVVLSVCDRSVTEKDENEAPISPDAMPRSARDRILLKAKLANARRHNNPMVAAIRVLRKSCAQQDQAAHERAKAEPLDCAHLAEMEAARKRQERIVEKHRQEDEEREEARRRREEQAERERVEEEAILQDVRRQVAEEKAAVEAKRTEEAALAPDRVGHRLSRQEVSERLSILREQLREVQDLVHCSMEFKISKQVTREISDGVPDDCKMRRSSTNSISMSFMQEMSLLARMSDSDGDGVSNA